MFPLRHRLLPGKRITRIQYVPSHSLLNLLYIHFYKSQLLADRLTRRAVPSQEQLCLGTFFFFLFFIYNIGCAIRWDFREFHR